MTQQKGTATDLFGHVSLNSPLIDADRLKDDGS
jgi:hypothetical protein